MHLRETANISVMQVLNILCLVKSPAVHWLMEAAGGLAVFVFTYAEYLPKLTTELN